MRSCGEKKKEKLWGEWSGMTGRPVLWNALERITSICRTWSTSANNIISFLCVCLKKNAHILLFPILFIFKLSFLLVVVCLLLPEPVILEAKRSKAKPVT